MAGYLTAAVTILAIIVIFAATGVRALEDTTGIGALVAIGTPAAASVAATWGRRFPGAGMSDTLVILGFTLFTAGFVLVALGIFSNAFILARILPFFTLGRGQFSVPPPV